MVEAGLQVFNVLPPVVAPEARDARCILQAMTAQWITCE